MTFQPGERTDMPGLRIQVYEREKLVHTAEFFGLVEIGRQAEGEGQPYHSYQDGNRRWIIVARLDETHVSRIGREPSLQHDVTAADH